MRLQVLAQTAAIVSILIFASGCSSSTQEVGSLVVEQQSSQEETAQSDVAEDSLYKESDLPDIDNVGSRLTDCVNSSVFVSEDDARKHITACFSSYSKWIGKVYGARSIGTLNLSSIELTNPELAEYTASFDYEGEPILEIRSFYTPQLDSFKVVYSVLTEYGQHLANTSDIKKVESL